MSSQATGSLARNQQVAPQSRAIEEQTSIATGERFLLGLPPPGVCWTCGLRRHHSRDCPRARRSRSPSGNGQAERVATVQRAQ